MERIIFYPQGPDYKKAREKLKRDIDRLYIKRDNAKWEEVPGIEMEINMLIATFNLDWPKANNYIDLHYATVEGALELVAQRISGTTRMKWYLESGIGHRSKRKDVSAIKEAFLDRYKGRISVDTVNQGLLILRV